MEKGVRLFLFFWVGKHKGYYQIEYEQDLWFSELSLCIIQSHYPRVRVYKVAYLGKSLGIEENSST